MPDAAPAPSTSVANIPQWNPDVIFPTLADPVRRRLLLSLARGGAQTGLQLSDGVGHKRDATLKHLAGMRTAGLVLMQDNPVDGRRQLYALSPTVPLTKTENGVVVDFGFVMLRL